MARRGKAKQEPIAALEARLTEHGIPAHISSRNLRQLLDLSKHAFNKMVDTGAFGAPITYSDDVNAYRMYRVSTVLEFLQRREQISIYRDNAAAAKARSLIRG